MSYYMHEISGDVATLEAWREDYLSMDVETWSGKTAEEHSPIEWIEDGKLIEVFRDVNGEWVGA